MELLGQSNIAVSDSALRVALSVNQANTLINIGTSLVAYRHIENAATLAGADEAALRAVGGGILLPSERVAIPAGLAWIDLACATGQNSTLRIEPGAVVPGVQLVADLDIGDVSVLNADGVKINPTAENRRIAGPTKITVDTESKTLATLGLTLNSATKLLRIITPTSGIFWAYGEATLNSTPLLTGTNEEFGTAAIFATLQFIVADATVDIWVEELG